MTDVEAYREAQERVRAHLRSAGAELGRAEVLAQALRSEVTPAAELAGIREEIDKLISRFIFGGVRPQPKYNTRELRWTLLGEMTLRERLLGRVGLLRHWRYRLRERARRRMRRAGVCG